MNDEEEMNEEGIAAASNNTTTTANDLMWINIMQTEVTRLSSKVTAHEHNVREMFEHRARDAKTAMDDMVSEMNKRMDDLAARIVVLEDEKAELRRINQRLTEKGERQRHGEGRGKRHWYQKQGQTPSRGRRQSTHDHQRRLVSPGRRRLQEKRQEVVPTRGGSEALQTRLQV